MTHEAGGRAAAVPGFIPLSDYLPDPERPAISDAQVRNLYLAGSLEAEHSTLTVGNTQTFTTDERLRIRRVQVGGVTGGTVTVQVYADGVPLFDDTVRPVSDTGDKEATELFNIPAGTVVETVIEATSGVPAGTANILIDTEPFVLVPTSRARRLSGKDRLRVSKRRVARSPLDDRVRELDAAFTQRALGGIASDTGPTPDEGGGGGGGGGGDAPVGGIPGGGGGGSGPRLPPTTPRGSRT